MRQLLDDFVVVEVSEEPAGGFCGKVFADLGADVVKLERPVGDPLRRRPGAFLHLHTNKRSVVVDQRDPEALATLLERAHVVIESLGWGDLASFGVDVAQLRVERPRLVIATISGFGAEGPYAGYRWTDLIGQAAGWAILPITYADTRPVKLPGITALCATGHTAALGALAAALRATATGAGTRVDCAMYEALGSVPSRTSRWLGWQYNQRPAASATVMSEILFPTGVFPCGDGFVSLMSTPQQLAEMLDALDSDELRAAFARPDALVRSDTKEILDAALYPWLLARSRAELTEIAQRAGWPFAGVNTPADVLEADHLHQRAYWAHLDHPAFGHLLLPGPPYRHAEGGWQLRQPAPVLGEAAVGGLATARTPTRWSGPSDPTAPPLRGVRVLDFTVVWAGPYATQLLADLGAEVIRVENPSVFPPTTKGYQPRPTGDMLLGSLLTGYAPPLEGRPDRPYNRHSMNNSISRNKLSCTLDPRRPEAKELLLRLVERSDVFIESLKISALQRMGLQVAELRDRNPGLVVMRIPPAGLAGDWAAYKGFGAQFDGLSGFASLTGHPDEAVVDTPATMYMDAATGPAAAFAVLAALHYRDGTGRGQSIELAQLENVIGHLGDAMVDQQLGATPERLGNNDPSWAPQGIYQCRGQFRWLAISVTDDDAWTAAARIIGGDTLARDERFLKSEDRLARRAELDELLSSWAAGQNVVTAFHELQGVGVAASPVLVDELLATDPNVAQRGWLRPLSSGDVGEYVHTSHALAGIPQAWDRGAPLLGEDNRYVYQGILGLDDEAYERLVDQRIAVEDYLDADLRAV